MKVKRTISALLAAACLSAGTNLLISNAAAVAPESIVSDAAYDKVNANYQGEINDLESRFDQITNMIRELLARMDNERSQLIAMEDEYVYMIDSGASKNKLKSII